MYVSNALREVALHFLLLRDVLILTPKSQTSQGLSHPYASSLMLSQDNILSCLSLVLYFHIASFRTWLQGLWGSVRATKAWCPFPESIGDAWWQHFFCSVQLWFTHPDGERASLLPAEAAHLQLGTFLCHHLLSLTGDSTRTGSIHYSALSIAMALSVGLS